MTAPRSGYCQTAPGIPSHASAHRVCQMLLDQGVLSDCPCEDHAGHTNPKPKDDT